MSSEVFQLAVLLTAKDAMSGTLDRAAGKLRSFGKEGDAAIAKMDKLRENLNRDISIGGIGIAGLMKLRDGVQSAATLEDAVLDLKQAYEENATASTKSRQQQESDIKRIMVMATELGNQLQGGTKDYVSLFTSMNKAGIDAEETLNGAGKAAAYLANVTGAIRNGTAPQLAEDLGSFGKMFDLKGDDWLKAVELFSALEDRFNISSGSLIESSKYFFSTAKSVMGLRGLGGAEETAKLFAFAKRYAGREGSEAGTSLESIITQFISHRKAVEALAKDEGIKLEFFDAKGNFQGVENMFAQFEKLRKLAPEERGLRLNAIFGEQGSRVANAMVEQGVEGWKNITNEANKSVSVNDKINAQMQTYSAKVEALGGSWENFKATAFTPLMEDAKKFVDYGSDIVNSLQKFSAENPGLMRTLGTIAAYGTTAMVVYSGFRTLTTGVKLFRLASAFSRGDGLVQYLNSTRTAADAAGTSLTTATTKAKGFKGAMSSIAGSSTIRIGLQIGAIMGLEYAISQAVQSYLAAQEAKKGQLSAIKSNSTVFNHAMNDPSLDSKAKQQIIKNQAEASLATLRTGGLFRALKVERGGWFDEMADIYKTILPSSVVGEGYKNTLGYDPYKTAKRFREDTPDLANSRVMTEFLRSVQQRFAGDDPQNVNARNSIFRAAERAFPESFSQAMKELSSLSFTPLTQSLMDAVNGQQQNAELLNQQNQGVQTFTQGLTNLEQPLAQTNQSIFNLGDSSNKAVSPLTRLAISANSTASSLNSVSQKLSNWQPPIPQTPQINVANGGNNISANSPVSTIPSRAVGGIVERDGLAMVHAGNVITPARVTKGLNTSGSGGIILHYSPQVTIKSDAKDAKAEFRTMLYEHSNDLDRILSRRMDMGRLRD